MEHSGYKATLSLFAASDNATRESELTNNVLEALVDRFGIATVTSALADVADAKADHVRTNWQDDPLAKSWERARDRLNKAALHNDLMVR